MYNYHTHKKKNHLTPHSLSNASMGIERAHTALGARSGFCTNNLSPVIDQNEKLKDWIN